MTPARRRPGDPAEQLVLTVAGLAARRAPRRVARGRPGTDAARGRLVRAAREILHAEPAAGLIELARRTGCSPHHLSRSFSQVTGSGVGRYRNRIRVAAAMERVELARRTSRRSPASSDSPTRRISAGQCAP